MKIHRLTATFGQLYQQTLELSDGLNIITAANETGKSTWCAFLTAMLYGINSRERDKAGYIAEKNRYAPWSGAPMTGRLECSAAGQELTLSRETRRAGAPMADFRAVYTGTGNPVSGVTGNNCGETLLGIPREVFERSVFIGQSGLGLTQDAELEKRIVSLITSGEEDTSYSEVSDILKKQLNRRRHNRTGQIPALEAERSAVQLQRSALQEQQRQRSELQQRQRLLEQEKAALEASLTRCRQWEEVQQRKRILSAQKIAEEQETHASQLRQQMVQERIPENDVIARLRGAIVNLETVRKSVDRAREERDEALKDVLRAQASVNESPFAGQTAESALQEAHQQPHVSVPITPSLVVFFLGLGVATAFAVLLFSLFGAWLSGWLRVLPWAGFTVITAGSALVSHAMQTHAIRNACAAALRKRFGTEDPCQISALADAYTLKLKAQAVAQEKSSAKSATYDALYASLSSNEQGILLEVRRFAPAAFDIPAADAALRECAQQRRRLSDEEAAARESRVRYETQVAQLQDRPSLTEQELALTPPEETAAALQLRMEQCLAQIAAAQTAADHLAGQIAATGDPLVLAAREDELSRQLELLEREYASLSMAIDVLTDANTALQNRFSPALGRRAAEIFSELTGGRYTGVVLDRALHLSAEPVGDSVYRDAGLLSAGALDQLYLSVRLAICQLVLPEDHLAPLILDDALANFDDSRCAKALGWLRKEAAHRQILLFTCHSREAELLRNDPEVTLRQLTKGSDQV